MVARARQRPRGRESLLEYLRGWKPGSRSNQRYQRRIAWWKETTGNFLGELYSLRQAADSISKRYFDGHQLPFASSAIGFAKQVECMEELVEGYNEDFANELELQAGPSQQGLPTASTSHFIDAAALEKEVAPAARQHTAFLVDMAKAEALDALGVNQAAVAVMERHI